MYMILGRYCIVRRRKMILSEYVQKQVCAHMDTIKRENLYGRRLRPRMDHNLTAWKILENDT